MFKTIRNEVIVDEVVIDGISYYNIPVIIETKVGKMIETTCGGFPNGPPGDAYRKFKPGLSSSTIFIKTCEISQEKFKELYTCEFSPTEQKKETF